MSEEHSNPALRPVDWSAISRHRELIGAARADAPTGPATPLVCVECGKTSGGRAVGWGTYLTVDGEIATYCPGCAQVEFGGRP